MTGIRKGLQAEISRQPLNVFICMKNLGLLGNQYFRFLFVVFQNMPYFFFRSGKGPDFSNLIVDMAAAKHPASSYEAPLFRM